MRYQPSKGQCIFSGIVGILNAITYLGGALSPYAVAFVAKQGGWSRAVMLWVALAVLSTVLCFTARRRWTDFKSHPINSIPNTTEN